MFDDLDNVAKPRGHQILKAPFGYPGGKSRSITEILPHLPYKNVYVEPFGGSAAILIARRRSPIEVYNDAYGGVVGFYRCIRDPKLYRKLIDRLELTLHSKEEFELAREWDVEDPVERAARWYYLVQSSFGGLGRNWGRATGGKSTMAGKIQNKLKHFHAIHTRFRTTQVENCDWEEMFDRYDGPETVFYCDPPYVDVHKGTYKNEMSVERHRDFLKRVFDAEGYVAVSGYSNQLYESQEWDFRYEWESFVSIQSVTNSEYNKKSGRQNDTRTHATEVLWIKL